MHQVKFTNRRLFHVLIGYSLITARRHLQTRKGKKFWGSRRHLRQYLYTDVHSHIPSVRVQIGNSYSRYSVTLGVMAHTIPPDQQGMDVNASTTNADLWTLMQTSSSKFAQRRQPLPRLRNRHSCRTSSRNDRRFTPSSMLIPSGLEWY